MPSELIINNDTMTALKEILAHKNIIQKVRELNFEKEEQVRDEINELKARKDEESELIILMNRYFKISDRDAEEKRIDQIKEEKELGKFLATDNNLIDWLLELDEINRDMKTKLKEKKLKRNRLVIRGRCK